MVLKIKSFHFLFLILIISLPSGMVVRGLNKGMSYTGYSLHEDAVRIDSRKLLTHDVVLDYDDAGPNPKHDPRRGGGGRKP